MFSKITFKGQGKMLSFLALPLFVLSTDAQEIKPIFPCSQRIENAYGVNCHLTFKQDYTRRDAELSIMRNVGINMVRGGAHFFALGYSNEEYHPNMMDSIVNSINKYRIPMHGDLSMDAYGKDFWLDYEDYKKYVDFLLLRYNKKVFTWEVINEVDLNLKTDNAAYKYTNLLKAIYPVFKNKGRKNKVLISGLADVRKPFLDSLCQMGAYKYFDVMNMHSYEQPERLPLQFEVLRRIMDKYGWNKEVWLGECGMSTAPDKNRSDRWSDSDWLIAEQARLLPRIYLIAFAYGINKVYWYEIRSEERDAFDKEHHFGLLHANLTFKPALVAYKVLISKCPDKSVRPKIQIVGENYLAYWITPSGKAIYAVWSVAPRPLGIKAEGNAKYYDLFGKSISQPKKLCPSIVYIENAKRITFVSK